MDQNRAEKIKKNTLKNVLTNVNAFDTMTPTNVITNVKTQFNRSKHPAHSKRIKRKTKQTHKPNKHKITKVTLEPHKRKRRIRHGIVVLFCKLGFSRIAVSG